MDIINGDFRVNLDNLNIRSGGDGTSGSDFASDMAQENGYNDMRNDAVQDSYNNDGPGPGRGASNLTPIAPLHINNYDGFAGKLLYLWDGGNPGNGGKYDMDGDLIGIAPIMLTVPDIGKGAALKGFKSAISFAKGGLTNVGRAIQKHPNILRLIGVEASSITTNASRNTYGAQALKYIIRNGTKEIKSHNSFGKVLEYKLPSGLGARFNAETNEFIGFLGRGL